MGFLSEISLFRYGASRALRKLCVAIAASVALTVPALAENITIAALGDSLTQGYGLPQEEGFVPQLQAWLSAQGAEATLINAGVSGDTTAGGLSRVAWTLTDDVDAMIVALGGNDLLRGIAPEVSRANLVGILDAAQQKGVPVMLVGVPAPNNYGPEYKAAFDAIYPELATQYEALHFESFLSAITERQDMQGAMRIYMQPDGIHPSAKGVALIVEAMGPSVLELISRAR
ncbi:Esterase TesA precursor [Actibacterium lipolyticum]|uniref:Esterase TesA n=1 Tax=Actibacterium lipolyticum TaxID=1524263 RepID=A0A238KQQ1_9RHOB|nr:Esterase TesA precursor [Actibacterium lipolyticum]